MTAQTLGMPAASAAVDARSGAQPAHWGGVFAMTLCVFALIVAFVVVAVGAYELWPMLLEQFGE